MNIVKVRKIRSAIRRPESQKRTLFGLGLKKMNKLVVLPDTLETRGMIKKVKHLVEVVEV